MNSTKPIVLGGGPAGSIFALALARAGHAVTLLEKASAAHHKVCGEFLSQESIQYLAQYGLHPRALGGVPITTVRLVTAWFQQEAALPFAAWSLTRKVLDEALLNAASRAGVDILRGTAITALHEQDGNWTGTVSPVRATPDDLPPGSQSVSTFTGRAVVLATGKLDLHGWSRPPGKQDDLVAFKMYYRLAEEQLTQLGNAVELILFPGGYAGLQLVDDRTANLCLLVDRQRLPKYRAPTGHTLTNIAEQTPHLRKRLHGAVSLLPKPLAAYHIPYGHLQRSTPHGLWRIGDQAAVIPSFCGDGTAIALHSGALAARCFLDGETSQVYQQTLYDQLHTRMAIATSLSRLLVGLPKASHAVRILPGLLRTIASFTRIPEDALGTTFKRPGETA